MSRWGCDGWNAPPASDKRALSAIRHDLISGVNTIMYRDPRFSISLFQKRKKEKKRKSEIQNDLNQWEIMCSFNKKEEEKRIHIKSYRPSADNTVIILLPRSTNSSKYILWFFSLD
jgi:hypothetical protein